MESSNCPSSERENSSFIDDDDDDNVVANVILFMGMFYYQICHTDCLRIFLS